MNDIKFTGYDEATQLKILNDYIPIEIRLKIGNAIYRKNLMISKETILLSNPGVIKSIIKNSFNDLPELVENELKALVGDNIES